MIGPGRQGTLPLHIGKRPIPTVRKIAGVGTIKEGVLILTFELSARADYFPATYPGTPHRSNFRADAEYHRRRVQALAYQYAVEMGRSISVFAAMRKRSNVFVGVFGPNEKTAKGDTESKKMA